MGLSMSAPPAAACLARPLATVADVCRLFEALAAEEPPACRTRAEHPQQAVAALLERVGHPERRLRVIHIAGSKGKGSTALLAEAILGAAGLRVGTFTSPHLQRWTERFRVGGAEVDAAAFVAAAEALRPHAAALWHEGGARRPRFFDFATALAFVLFEREGVDAAVIEAGIGGRRDATNVVVPVASCITSIELEHTDRLGDTVQAIAFEKAGVIKPGVPVVVGALPPLALDVVLARAAAAAAPAQVLGCDFTVEVAEADAHGLSLRLGCGRLVLAARLPVLGAHLAGNAALAAVCVAQSGLVAAERLPDAIVRGLAGARLPGRTEILCRQPWVVADGAHTEVSAMALMQAVARLGCGERHMVVSLSTGKNLPLLLAILLSGAKSVTVTRADPQRSLAPAFVAASAAACFPHLPVRVVADPLRAVTDTLAVAAPDALVCVTGSVYVAGAARGALIA